VVLMIRVAGIRLLLIVILAAAFSSLHADAQESPDEIPLGDVARNLRKKTGPARPVIDDDNFAQVMQEADSHQDFARSLRFVMSGNRRGFQVEAPDVTCSLSFSANVKSLLSGQYAEMELPPTEISKIEGKAVVEGDALTVPIFNGTQWHLSEIAVAFTVIRKATSASVQMVGEPSVPRADTLSALDLQADAFQQVRPEKKPDVTVIYRMRAAGLPWSNTVFSAPLHMELDPGEEWHWSIVQAKGYPPETYLSGTKAPATEAARQESVPSAVSLKSSEPENAGSVDESPHK